jgi:hypothetical protein
MKYGYTILIACMMLTTMVSGCIGDDGVVDSVEILGCMDSNANDYNENATDAGSCDYDLDDDGILDSDEILGCMDYNANDYNENATDAGSCDYDLDDDGILDSDEILGCMDYNANDYNENATDAGSCDYDLDDDGILDSDEILGCMDSNANDYNENATDAGSCDYDLDDDGILDSDEILGCMDSNANDYNENATDAGSCDYDLDNDGVVDSDDECPYDAGSETNSGCPDGEGECAMNWPEDPFHAAIYSFIAEYELGYGASVGCFFDYYPDQSYEGVAMDLEDNWGSGNALEYAQAWVDSNAADNGQDSFNLTSVFNISEGGLGWTDGGGNGNGGGGDTDCGEQQNSTSGNETNSSYFEIEENPNPDYPGMKCFTKYVEVFGLGIYAESGLTDAQVLHAASVLAELLDNDEDGFVDDEVLLNRLQNMSAMMPMFDYEGSPAYQDFAGNYNGEGVSAVLFADEVDPTQPGHWGSDATVEEIMHTINAIGHTYVYSEAFGLEPNSSLLSDAMDEARGGQFIDHPSSYPEEAWYHYDDATCDYQCMAIEYMYWVQVSNMGILNDTETCDGIADEWEPCSKELLESMDVLIYALITDSQYHLPQYAPDGNYSPNTE